MHKISYSRHRFPGSIIQHAVWLYFRFPLSFRDVEDLLAEVYRRKVANLAEALNEENTRADAAQAIQELIEEVRLVPTNGTLKIELFGQLAALISLTNKNPRSKDTGAQVTLVAGAGFVQDPTKTELRKAV